MTSDLDSLARSTGDRRRVWAYHRDFWPGILGYVVALIAVVVWGDMDGQSSWRFLWAMLPVIPTLWVVRAVVRHLRRVDDYQRLLVLQGLSLGFAAAMITSVAVGFLGLAGLALPMPLAAGGWLVFTVGMLGWVFAASIVAQRAQQR